MKEKIKKLLLGCKEDALIGLNLLLEHYDPKEFIKEWAVEMYNNNFPYNNEDDRHGLYSDSILTSNDTMFYYKIREDLYILIRIGVGPFMYFKNYDYRLKVINHE